MTDEQYLWQFLDKKDDLMVVDSFVKTIRHTNEFFVQYLVGLIAM